MVLLINAKEMKASNTANPKQHQNDITDILINHIYQILPDYRTSCTLVFFFISFSILGNTVGYSP